MGVPLFTNHEGGFLPLSVWDAVSLESFRFLSTHSSSPGDVPRIYGGDILSRLAP